MIDGKWTEQDYIDICFKLNDLSLISEGKALSDERKEAFLRVFEQHKDLLASRLLRALNLALRTYEEHRMPLPGYILGMVSNRP